MFTDRLNQLKTLRSIPYSKLSDCNVRVTWDDEPSFIRGVGRFSGAFFSFNTNGINYLALISGQSGDIVALNVNNRKRRVNNDHRALIDNKLAELCSDVA